MPLPQPSTLPTLTPSTLTPILDLLFEPSPPLHTLILPLLQTTTYPTYPALITAIKSKLLTLSTSTDKDDVKMLEEVLCAHPRLGEKKVESEMSRGEQEAMNAAAGKEDGGEKEEEARMLKELNEEYEERFPGLRYVVFVNARPRPVIMQNMRERIERGDIAAERREAIEAMCDIAVDRVGKVGVEGE